jgi:uncharacterized membrane protein YdjX (TVP38/TMEM64 family)
MTRFVPYLFFGVLTALLLAPFFAEPVVITLETLIEGHTFISYGVFVLLLVFATICMPISVMPMIPMVSMVLGPFTTGILSVIGWTVGGWGAFLIARYIGRPFVSRYIRLERIDRVIGQVGTHGTFWGIVLLRLSMPVDVVSYALGFSSAISFRVFALATLIGVVWFSFAFAYLGEALLSRDSSILVCVGGVSLLVFGGGWYMLWRRRTKKE